jgi:hypothetical protein
MRGWVSGRGEQGQEQKQIPPLRCGMTNKEKQIPPLLCGMTDKGQARVLGVGNEVNLGTISFKF